MRMHVGTGMCAEMEMCTSHTVPHCVSRVSTFCSVKDYTSERFNHKCLEVLCSLLCNSVVLVLQEEQETSYTILRAKGCNVTLNGLKSNTAYLLQIRARTAAGYGASSPSFQFETSPDCKHGVKSLAFDWQTDNKWVYGAVADENHTSVCIIFCLLLKGDCINPGLSVGSSCFMSFPTLLRTIDLLGKHFHLDVGKGCWWVYQNEADTAHQLLLSVFQRPSPSRARAARLFWLPFPQPWPSSCSLCCSTSWLAGRSTTRLVWILGLIAASSNYSLLSVAIDSWLCV